MIIKDVRKLNTEYWQHQKGTIGGILTEADDIGQCLETIATTQKGTVPHNPLFGFDLMEFQDMPLNQIEAKLKTALLGDLSIQEPRAEITDIVFNYDNGADGHLKCNIKYNIKNGNTNQEKEIQLW